MHIVKMEKGKLVRMEVLFRIVIASGIDFRNMVMIDKDLVGLYQFKTKRLNSQIRNI